MQRQEILIRDNLRVVLFRSFLNAEGVNLVYQRIIENLPSGASEIVLLLKGANSLDVLLREYAGFFSQGGFVTSEVKIEKYASKVSTQGGIFLFLGKASVRLGSEIVLSVSFGDLLSIRGGSLPVEITSEKGRMFVLSFSETTGRLEVGLLKYRQMSLQQLEELAYAVQIPYLPPLDEEQRENVLQGIKWILEHPNLTEEEKEALTQASRVKVCDNPNTPIGYDNVLLKSDAQLAFMPDGDKYYCLDKVVDLPEVLRQRKNLSNMKNLTPEQIAFLEQIQSQNLYPRIATGDYFDEVASRLQGQVEPDIPLYRRRAEELAELIRGIGLDYSANAVISFANDLSVEQYNVYLRHKSLRQEVESIQRDEAAAEALGILLRYYTQKNQISTEQGGYALREIGKTVEEYAAMIQNNWDYETLLREMGTEGELYWQPRIEYLDEEEDLIREGQVTPDGRRVGEWILRYHDGTLHSRGSYNQNGQETGSWTGWHDNGNKKEEGDYLNGQKTGSWTVWYNNENKIEEGNYLNDEKTGRWIFWWSNGTKDAEGDYFNGQRTGHWTEWYDNGTKSSEGDYLNDQKTGRWTFWDNGIKSSEGDHLNDKRTGRWTFWYNGIKWTEGDYLNGQMTGHWITWHDNGIKSSEGNYFNDQKTGHWITWHDNGIKSSEGNYFNDQRTGHWITWHDNGIKSGEGDYLNGEKTGHWTEWRENESKESEGNYLNDQMTGHWFFWNNDGTKASEVDYLLNKKTGHWIMWYNNGNKASEGDYVDDKKTGSWVMWYENRNKLTEGDFLNGQKTGLWTEWWENGTKKSEGNYLNDQKTGHWITWHDNGIKSSEGNYFNDQKTGQPSSEGPSPARWISWHNNGTKASEGDYLHDQKTGRWVEWYENEFKRSEGNYVNGQQTGHWIFWDESGNKSTEGDYLNGQPTGRWIS